MELSIHYNVSAGLQAKYETITPILLTLFRDAVARIDFDFLGTLEIWITDAERYGTTISQIAPDEGYSKNDLYVGIGKTITKVNSDNTYSCFIILRDYVVLNAIELADSETNTDDVPTKEIQDQCRYAIAHELGHCKDDTVRVNFNTPSYAPNSKHWIAHLAVRNIPIIASEYAASFHSATEMSPSVFSIENTSTAEALENLLRKFRALREAPMTTEEKLKALRSEGVASGFWLIFIQYAKLFGSQLGNSALTDLEIETWASCDTLSERVLGEFWNDINNLWAAYPHWTYEMFDFIVPLWRALANANGFDFIAGTERDGIYW